MMTALATTTVLLEYILAFGIFVPRIRTAVLLSGVLLHLVFYALLSVNTFSLNMILLYLAVIDADRVHAFIDAFHGYPDGRQQPQPAP